ncbi:MAG: MoaD/ThiS family protein [Synergistaceae bacterium]|jgi:molybdopterin converting factor small subunit|nr:MoaD/ThiS family protein [Synergistaceae bacterium]
MTITIQIPTALRAFTDRQPEVRVEGATVEEAIADLARICPDIAQHLYEENGALRSFINVYFGDVNVKNLKGLETPLKDGDAIILVPAIAGGGGICP